MRKFSRALAVLLCAVLAAACVVPACARQTRPQDQSKTPSLSIMLMVDDTVSMQVNDPNHFASQALQKFVDIIPSEGSYIGMATYDDDILTKVPDEQALVFVRTLTDKDRLKAFAESGLTQNGRFTDLPRALYYALEQVRAVNDPESKPAIIVVSDGENDYMNETARKNSEEYLNKVCKAGVPVYLLVINANNAARVEDYMNDIAMRTGGEAYFIQSGDEIGEQLTEIVYELYDYVPEHNSENVVVEPEQPKDWLFTLGDDIFEANLELKHVSELDVQLLGPGGTVIPLDGNDDVVVTSVQGADGINTVVKLIEPNGGDYVMKLTSDTEQSVEIKVILNKEIKVQVELSPAANEVEDGDTVQVTAKLMRGNEQYTGLEFVNLSAAVLLDSDDPVEMTRNADDDTFQGEVTVSGSGDHTLVVSVKGQKSFYLESDPVVINFSGSSGADQEIQVELSPAPGRIKDGDTVQVTAELMRGGEPCSDDEFANLTATVTLDDEDPVTMDPNSKDNTFETELTVEGSGKHKLVVNVQGQAGFDLDSDPVKFEIGGNTGLPLWVIIVAAVLLVLIIVVVLLLVLRRKPKSKYIRLQGTLTVTYLDDMRQYIWERYVQPGRYYSPRGPVSLGKMLRDQQGLDEIPGYFDQLMVGGVQYGPGQIAVEITGTLGEGQVVSSRIMVSTGQTQDDFDSFDDMSSTVIMFPNGTQAEMSFSVG